MAGLLGGGFGPSLPAEVVQELRRNWVWCLALGILLIVLGMLALGNEMVTGLIVVKLYGWLLFFSAAGHAYEAFQVRHWSGFVLHLLAVVLDLAVGSLIVLHPELALNVLTLLIALYLFVSGVFRFVFTLAYRFPGWPWSILSGVISFLLGLMIWRQWPYSAEWVIGVFVGIELVFRGVSWVMAALLFRNLPEGKPA